MSFQYDQYIERHRSKVLEAFRFIQTNLPELVAEEKFSDDQPLTIRVASFEGLIKNHDMSKYSLEEYNAYDAYFYGNNKSYQVVEEFNKAWIYHIHNNKHHWQYWVLVRDEPNGDDKCVEMPYEYVIEMICDWWSFSWSGLNLYEIFDWYTEHEERIELHPNTRKLVTYILGELKKKLDEQRSDFEKLKERLENGNN